MTVTMWHIVNCVLIYTRTPTGLNRHLMILTYHLTVQTLINMATRLHAVSILFLDLGWVLSNTGIALSKEIVSILLSNGRLCISILLVLSASHADDEDTFECSHGDDLDDLADLDLGTRSHSEAEEEKLELDQTEIDDLPDLVGSVSTSEACVIYRIKFL